jgi:DDE_Tnp_1-associated
MDYTTLAPPPVAMSEGDLTDRVGVISLYEALQRLPDPRRGQGKRYELARLFSLLLVAKLAGQTTLKGATEWIRHRADKIAEHFGLTRKQMPCQMTYCRILGRVDAQALDELLAAFFIRWEAGQRCENEPSRKLRPQGHLDHAQLAIDGKTRRSTRTQAHPVHQLRGSDVTTGTVLWQCHVGEKQNEISALKPLLDSSPWSKGGLSPWMQCIPERGTVYSGSAIGGSVCARGFGQPTDSSRRYCRPVSAIAPLIGGAGCRRRRGASRHGRLEHRQIISSPDRNRVVWQAVARHRAGLSPGTHRLPPQNRGDPSSGGLWTRAFSRCAKLQHQECWNWFAIIGKSKTGSTGEEMSGFEKIAVKRAPALLRACWPGRAARC